MKAKLPAHFILLCLFTFHLLSSSSSSSSMLQTGRRSLDQTALPHHHKDIYPSAKVALEESNEHMDDDEIVNYHTDYHGVTTHPTPTPKHPKP
ncbi:hypothetical protein GQ457_03G031470 [Hibiscus cannabinus]